MLRARAARKGDDRSGLTADLRRRGIPLALARRFAGADGLSLRLRERSIRKTKAAIQSQRSKVGVVVSI